GARVPVRLLHAQHGADGDAAARGESAAERGGGPAGDGRQPLPLRLLRQDRRRRPAGGREGGGRVDELSRFRLDDRVVLVAVGNAVGGGAGAALHDAEAYPQQDWAWIMDLNLTSQFLMSKAAARAMIAGGRGGRILNISSVRGQLGVRLGYSAYVAAKGAMNALTRQHATEWAKHGITVNAISPTFVRTPQVEGLLADEPL